VIQEEVEGKLGVGEPPAAGQAKAARRRAAVEMVARYEHALKRTARRYSLDAEDVEDAFQRALEIVLTKAPTTDPRELIRWTQTVIKHEALAVRRNRERLLGVGPGPGSRGVPPDPVALLPARGDGPDEQAERREDVARTREALQALKPAELRTLTLLAEGYSYAEIADITNFSLTKINRCLAEGRERFRAILCSSESGDRCRELRPLISAFCDGEASAEDSAVVREHLRACAHCRATMRTYRTAPRLASALVPVLPLPASLLTRTRELISGLGAKAAAAKQIALCAAVAGGATAGMATGVLPSSFGVDRDRQAVRQVPVQQRQTEHQPNGEQRKRSSERRDRPAGQQVDEPRVEAGPTSPVEYAPVAPAPEPAPPPTPAPGPSAPSGSAAGEFGP
jgi:RNA polymerase sigma factor (sigma-70 family)